jgi:aspartyl aminopeptidase
MPAKKRKGGKNKLEKLAFERCNSWEAVPKKDAKFVEELSCEYKAFLDIGKTEREAANIIVSMAKAKGFVDIEGVKGAKKGDKLFFIYRKKVVALIVMGSDPLEKGINLIGSHIDAPRLDLKPNPLYQDKSTDLALLRTHYYGGVKKYNWANVPLALHGFVVKGDGSEIHIIIGEAPGDPVLIIPDLEPHLYHKAQASRKLSEGFKGEELRIVVANKAIGNKKMADRVKLWVLNHLNERYGIIEEDFCSAEFEVVPALKAADVGLDRSFVGAYGQDDRVCAFTSMRALFDAKVPKRTCVALFFDKEEIGSTGSTGAESFFLRNLMGKLFRAVNKPHDEHALWDSMLNSHALSADVTGAVNPIFKDVHEMSNAPIAGRGIVFSKYTGAGGKFAASDANPEFVGKVRRLFNSKKIPWQSAELGKVDEGGGGTIAKFLARYGMEVVDCGPGLISIHTPYELTSKVDLYNTYRAYKAFFEMV